MKAFFAVVVAASVPAQGVPVGEVPTARLSLDHDAVACVVADKYPMFGARIDPADQVARARVYFRGGGQALWYYVEMAPTNGVFWGTLPKPTRSLQRVEYYVQAWSRALEEARSPEHAPRVVSDEGECRKEGLIGFLDRARVELHGAEGGAPVPEGFSPEGVVAAAATPSLPSAARKGISGKTVGLGLGGLAAVGLGLAAAGGSSTPAGAPQPTVPIQPTPPPTTTVTFNATIFGPGSHADDCTDDPYNYRPGFTTRTAGRADVSLTFAPIAGQELSVDVIPGAPLISGTSKGPGPTLAGSFRVGAATSYYVRICVHSGSTRQDLGPFAITLSVTHP